MNTSRTFLGLPPAIAAVLAVVVVAVTLLAAGGYLRTTSEAVTTPLPSPPATTLSRPLSTATPMPAATAMPEPTPTGSQPPFVRQLEPGTAVPDKLLGAWFDRASGSFYWLIRAGDPYCVRAVATSQDCLAYQLPDGSSPYGGIATMAGIRLALVWTRELFCGLRTQYEVVLAGATLTLTPTLAGCPYEKPVELTRAGSGSSPTAPAEPLPVP